MVWVIVANVLPIEEGDDIEFGSVPTGILSSPRSSRLFFHQLYELAIVNRAFGGRLSRYDKITLHLTIVTATTA